MKTIIAGSRDITDHYKLMPAIDNCGWSITEVVSGCCRGVDQLGAGWAKRTGLPATEFPADWNRHGRSAGPIRNRQMAEYAEACIVIHNGSRGAASMIREAKAAGLKLYVFNVTTGERGNVE